MRAKREAIHGYCELWPATHVVWPPSHRGGNVDVRRELLLQGISTQIDVVKFGQSEVNALERNWS